VGIYGQDWASYQSATPNTTGLSFAFVKVTEGLSYINPEWVSQRDHAKAAGLVWGGYAYPHMANSPQAEADRFLAQVNWQPGDLICLDWEGYDAANSGVPKAQQAAYKDAWLKYVKQRMPHNPVGMYANTDYWLHVDSTGFYGDFLWIATAGRAAGDPGIQAPWLFHQYSDNPVDSDYCHLGSTAELRTWALSFAQPTPAPAPTPAPPPEDIVTPQDIQAIADAVWNWQVPIPRPQPDGSIKYEPDKQSAYWPLIWGNVWTPQILAAIKAAELTPEKLAQALADGTLKVQISVAPAASAAPPAN
jgi:hypothetical protein